LLIYAGGDDVLAVVKAKRAFEIAKKLAKDFTTTLNDNGSRDVTASVGIAIGSTKAPLQDLIKEAQVAESRAKHVYGRDALAVCILKRSGEILHWGCKWNSRALKIYEELSKVDGRFSRFAYKLAGFLEPYGLNRRDTEGKPSIAGEWGDMKNVIKAETMHAVSQTEGMDKVLMEDDVEAYLGENSLANRPEDFLGLFLCETFITRPRD
jgi:CRISPR/Cas system-associated protein Cas10 (large subunit of type III CRISPR-Cas system)